MTNWYDSMYSSQCVDYAMWNKMISSICHHGPEYITQVMPWGLSSSRISGQLLSMHSSRDINAWNSHNYNNSGLVWDDSLKKFKAMKSGGGTGTANSGDFKASTATWAWMSSQRISANVITSAYLNAISSNLDAKIDEITGVGRGGYASVANGGTISHGFGSLPNNVTLAPSGSAAPLVYSFKIDTSNITVYHSSKDAEIFSWRCEGTDPGTDAANGWQSIAACLTGQAFAHGLGSKPVNFAVCPSGASPMSYTASCDATNIKIIHSSKTAEIFSWRGEI